MTMGVFYASLALYLLSTSFYLLFIAFNRPYLEKSGYSTAGAAFVVHFLSTLFRYGQAGYTPITNTFESFSFFALCIAGFFLYLRKSYGRTEILGTIILPVLSLLLLWASTYPTDIRPLPPVLRSYWLPIHTVFSFAGNAVFFTSFCVSLFYLAIERAIKKKRVSAMSGRLPSLETLDLINYRCMSYGFPLLTIGIITGSLWAGLAWGSYWNWDPKETWSLITWIVYAILIHNRLAIGWRGRKTAYMMILGFFSILVTFLGVNFFIGGLHSYV